MHISKISLIAAALAAAPLTSRASGFLGVGINIGGPVVVQEAPPAPLVENVGPAPGPDYVWVSGHWYWHHHHWEWAGGTWDRRPAWNQTWVAGHWDRRGDGSYVWIDGQWAIQSTPNNAYESVEVAEAPPAPVNEVIGVSPGPDFFWIGGRWVWHGRWVWSRGHYEHHPHFHAGGGWEAGHWDHRDRGYVWVEGHWR